MHVLVSSMFISLLLTLSVSSQKSQEHHVTLTDANGDEYEGVVEVSVSKGEEVFKTAYTLTEDGEVAQKGVDGPYSVRDTNKKIDATVYEEYGMCFLERNNANAEVPALGMDESIKSDRKTVGNPKKMILEKMKVIDTPIEDVSAVSAVIASHCEDKDSYWSEVESEEVTCDGKECEEEITPEVGVLCSNKKCETQKGEKCKRFFRVPVYCRTTEEEVCKCP